MFTLLHFVWMILNIWLSLKGVCQEIFNLYYFHDSTPPERLINRLKYFLIWFQFGRGIHSVVSPMCAAHSGDQKFFFVNQHFILRIFSFMIDVLTIKGFILIVPLTATRGKWRLRFWLRSVQFVSEVCCTPLRSSLLCVAHHWDLLHDVLHTAKIISVVCCTPKRSSPRCFAQREEH